MTFNKLKTALRAFKILSGYQLKKRLFIKLENANIAQSYQGIEVHISRVDNGVPCIESSNELALYFGYGYSVARDRLWQLDVLRRKAIYSMSAPLLIYSKA